MRTEKLKELLAQLLEEEEEAGKEESKATETIAKSSMDQKTEKSKEESTPSKDCGNDQGHFVDSSTCNNSNTSNSIRDNLGEDPDTKWVRVFDAMCARNSLDSVRAAGKRWRARV